MTTVAQNTQKAVEILKHCIANKVSCRKASVDFGQNDGYVSDVKRRLSAKYDQGLVSAEEYDFFMDLYEEYEESQKITSSPATSPQTTPTNSLQVSEDDSTLVLDYKNNKQIKGLDELLRVANVDLNLWRVDSHVINKWDTHAKDENGEFKLAQNFQVKAILKKREDYFNIKSIKDELKKELIEFSPKYSGEFSPTKYPFEDSKNLLEISIFDLHLGKLAWHGESFEDYDIHIAKQRFAKSIAEIINKASVYGFERILFPVGNDFFNSDTKEGLTSNGTPQMDDVRWKKSYKIGRELLVNSINMLREYAPVDVVVIPGNHDETKMFYIGDSLELFYENYPDVVINNHGALRKYYKYGQNLIGLTHGKYEKAAELPLLMANEAPDLWKDTYFREWHLGHIHTKKEYRHLSTNEYKGVVVRYLSSVSGTEEWHHKMGYVGNIKGATGFLWNKDNGLSVTIDSNIKIEKK